ncbi:MAG: beta-glucosidase, partial [Lachnospiraceae bacterium]
MTDWWARMNEEGKDTVSITKTTCMIRAQNDVYMVVGDASQNSNGDDTSEGLQTGAVTRGELLRNAKNILYVLKKSPVSARLLEGEDEITEQNRPKEEERRKNVMQEAEVRDETILNLAGLDTTAGTGNSFSLHIPEKGIYTIYFKMKSDLGELAQMTMSVLLNNVLGKSITINGTKGEWIEEKAEFEVHVAIENYLELYFAQSGIQLDEVRIKKTGEIQIPYLT